MKWRENLKLLDHKKITVSGSKSVVSLEYQTQGWGERFLNIEQSRAYWLGYPCGTCNFVFERLNGAQHKVSPHNLITNLSSGVIKLDDENFGEILEIIPDGNYIVLLLEMSPQLIIPGSLNDYFVNTEGINHFSGFHHHPKVKYYMDNDIELGPNESFHTFTLPIVPEHWLDKNTVKKYKSNLGNGIQSTALALSYLDITERGDKIHTCFVNILLDGHHKTFAASGLRNSKPVHMISFLSTDMGVSTERYIYEYIDYLSQKSMG